LIDYSLNHLKIPTLLEIKIFLEVHLHKETAYVVKLIIMILNSYFVSCVYHLPMKVTTLQLL